MPLTTIPTITELPPNPPSSADPDNFDPRADALLDALPTMVTQENAAIVAMNALGGEVQTLAGQASGSATTATQKAAAAAGSATAAAQSVGDFPTRYLGAKNADPTTDNAGQPLAVGALYWNTPTGQLRAWSGAAWAVSYLPVGDYLTKAGGTLTGALNEARGASIPSAATLDLNAATGNFVHITGTNAVTAVTLAPGAARTVIFDGALTLAHSATLQLPGLANIVTAPGDRATFRGDAGGVVHCIYDRLDGKALVGPPTAPTLGMIGTALSVESSYGAATSAKIARLTNTLAVVATADGSYLKVRSLTFNGASVTLGPVFTNAIDGARVLGLAALDATRVILVTWGSSQYMAGWVFTVAADGSLGTGGVTQITTTNPAGVADLVYVKPGFVLLAYQSGAAVQFQALIPSSSQTVQIGAGFSYSPGGNGWSNIGMARIDESVTFFAGIGANVSRIGLINTPGNAPQNGGFNGQSIFGGTNYQYEVTVAADATGDVLASVQNEAGITAARTYNLPSLMSNVNIVSTLGLDVRGRFMVNLKSCMALVCELGIVLFQKKESRYEPASFKKLGENVTSFGLIQLNSDYAVLLQRVGGAYASIRLISIGDLA
ncbi:hypothetical protein [uncultured Xylophilus sp.]|uniref:hypothetical protein n=1 Tax=uncultured Xylophilus sp. TaxID=296832 RepID=UPI0025D29B78|nr:hypothetical protein [uncultured Xylophilus sp.]